MQLIRRFLSYKTRGNTEMFLPTLLCLNACTKRTAPILQTKWHDLFGPVHMGRSYLGSRENISTGQIMLFCSYGKNFSRLPGKVSRDDVDFVKCKKQKVFPLSGKVVFIWDKDYLGDRDLACHPARSRLTGKLFVSYERKVTFHTIFVRSEISLVNLSKCFLANRANFFPL